jgi:hypothetical protein
MSDDEDEVGGKPRAKFHFWRSPETKLEKDSADTGKEEELLKKLDLQRHDEDGKNVPATYGTIDFVTDRDNDAPARFIVVSSNAEPQSICKVMTNVWHLARPSVILSVTGGANSLDIDTQLEAAYVKGLANAAQSTRSWIITGGADAGVMGLTGKVLSSADPHPHPRPKPHPHPHPTLALTLALLPAQVMSWLGAGTPCIGIAPLNVLMYKDKVRVRVRGGVREGKNSEHV